MTEEHANLFQLLVEIDDFCNENGIEYYLAGGSSLGAVRNHCFLPWDDDIDLYITRENWNKLISLYEDNPGIIPDNRLLVCAENEKYHRNPIARYVKTDTTIIFSGQEFSGKTCGQQIEFFILDPIPNEDDGREEFYKLYKVYIEMLVPYFITNKNASIEDFEQHFKLYKHYYDRGNKIGFNKVIEELEHKVLTVDESRNFDTYTLRWGQRSLLHPKKNYEGKRTIEFEGREFPIPSRLEHSLRVDYGDSWMYVPSGDGQLKHNPIVEDISRPFSEYTASYLPKLDREKLISYYTKNKFGNMTLFVKRRKIEIAESNLKRIVCEKEFKKTILPRLDEIRGLIAEHRYDLANDILKRYYTLQLSKNMRRYNILIDLGDDFITLAIENYIRQGLYYLGNNLLQLRKKAKKTWTNGLQECQKMIDAFREMSIARYDYKSVENLTEVLERHREFSDTLDYVRAKIWLMFENAKMESSYQEILEFCKMQDSIYDDGEIKAFIGRAYFKLGKTRDALHYYEEAVSKTRNGFVWYEAKVNAGIDRIKEA
ncbi:LICD family protein [Eubacterium nodatum ATCC 33099]|nr:LICD family protein [Eubacterium nodatum ATCC 33099]